MANEKEIVLFETEDKSIALPVSIEVIQYGLVLIRCLYYLEVMKRQFGNI